MLYVALDVGRLARDEAAVARTDPTMGWWGSRGGGVAAHADESVYLGCADPCGHVSLSICAAQISVAKGNYTQAQGALTQAGELLGKALGALKQAGGLASKLAFPVP
jgi:hypothetical protein